MGRKYSPERTAKKLGVNIMTVYRMIWRGHIEAIKVGNRWRVPQAAIDRYLAERTNTPTVARAIAPQRIEIAHTDVPILREVIEAGCRTWLEETGPDVDGDQMRRLDAAVSGVREQLAMISPPQ